MQGGTATAPTPFSLPFGHGAIMQSRQLGAHSVAAADRGAGELAIPGTVGLHPVGHSDGYAVN